MVPRNLIYKFIFFERLHRVPFLHDIVQKLSKYSQVSTASNSLNSQFKSAAQAHKYFVSYSAGLTRELEHYVNDKNLILCHFYLRSMN